MRCVYHFFEFVLEDPPRVLADLNFAGDPVGFHPARYVHGVAPKIVNEFVATDDPGDHRSGIHPDPDLDTVVEGTLELLHLPQNVDRETGDRLGVIFPRRRKAGHRHVGVPDRLDFFQAMFLGDQIHPRRQCQPQRSLLFYEKR